MAVYFFLIILLLTGSTLSVFCEWFPHSKTEKFLFYGLCALLILLSGLRFDVGADYKNYKAGYEAVYYGQNIGFSSEIGFIILMKIFAALRLPTVAFFLVTSVLIVVPIADTIQKKSEYPILSLSLFVLLYFYFISLNLLRQYIAVAIVFWAANCFIERKKFLYYLISILVATCFHTSACMMIILYFVWYFKLTKRNKIIIYSCALALIIFGKPLTKLVLSIWPKYSVYLGVSGGSAYSDLVVQTILLFLLIMYGRKKDIRYSIRYRLYFSCALLSMVMSFMTGINVLFARLETYFYIESLLSIPNTVSKAGKYRKVYFLAFLTLGTLICVRYLFGNNCGVVPYQFVFGK